MKHLLITCLLASGFLLVSPAETPVSPEAAAAKKTDIIKLLELTGAASNARLMMQPLIDQFKQAMPQVPDSFWTDFMKEVKDEEILELSVPGFDKHLSHDDIKELVKFYESSVGRRFTEAQPKILQDNMAAGMAWGQKLGQRVLEKLQEKKIKID